MKCTLFFLLLTIPIFAQTTPAGVRPSGRSADAVRTPDRPDGRTASADRPDGRTPGKWTTTYWEAKWIVCPTAPAKQYGVYHFRKTISLPQKPAKFVVHVSADNRYRFFVNGRAIATGPARSDTQNWNYETLDLAPYMQVGANTLAAMVWNMGAGMPYAQMSYQTGFIVQGDTEAEKIANTDKSWKAIQDSAYSPVKNDIPKLRTYIVVGDGDRVDAARYPWGWEQPGFNDANWPAARDLLVTAKPRGLGTDGNWNLVPRQIPMMEEVAQRLRSVRRADSLKIDEEFLAGTAPVTIPANRKVVVLFDQGVETNAYPELTVGGGRGATITLAYAEALVDEKLRKGNRNDIEGRHVLGFEDQFLADGTANRTFRPLWFRTFRYLQLTIETKDEPLTLTDLIGKFTGYPFVEKAEFNSPDSSLSQIWTVGWRTARLCAGETYFDCPYYEQLQYTGDTRIQALISLYVSGDDRLMRKAILDYDHSRFNDGLTQSRYPSADFQVIPTFSLYWVCMIHDYWMHRQDDAFIKPLLRGMDDVLAWHEERLDKTLLNGPLPWWNFVDWADWNTNGEAAGGVPVGARNGGSAILTLQQVYTLQRAADVFAYFGRNERAEHYRQLALRMNKAVYERCWDADRGLIADTAPDSRTSPKKRFSQHANIWAILTDAIPAGQQQAVLKKVMADANGPDSLTQATFYFKFYLFQAMKKTGLADQFGAQLKPWRDMLALGLTTFAEEPDRIGGRSTRSDCHAWSASPVYEMLSTICGISPAEPGFRSVRLVPYLGDLPYAEGRMPHPAGDIAVNFTKTPTGGLTGFVTLPANLTGTLRWQGKTQVLKSGTQSVNL